MDFQIQGRYSILTLERIITHVDSRGSTQFESDICDVPKSLEVGLDKQSSRYRSNGFVHETYCTISLRNMADMPDEERKRRRRRAAQEMVWRVEKVGGAS
jgi:hypothetical protein